MSDSNDGKLLRDAQYRKGLSIAFFNATNSAIALIPHVLSKTELLNPTKVRKTTFELRDAFLEEHRKYYASTIDAIGQAYDPKDALAKLDAVKTLAELHVVWLMFSADERGDDEISRKAQELKAKFEKAKRVTEEGEPVIQQEAPSEVQPSLLETPAPSPKKKVGKKPKKTNKKA